MKHDDRIADYLRSFLDLEDEPLRAARARSEEADLAVVPLEVGTLLRWAARAIDARNVVEVGSGGGYSGLWLLGGMHPRGHLTTIEADPDYQALAQRAYAEAKMADRVRSILGHALSVLPKLADGAYDLVVILDRAKSDYPAYLEHARRLLRSGGLLVADRVLRAGQVADEGVRDEHTEGLRAFNADVREDPGLFPAIIPTGGDGLLAAVYRPEEEVGT